jgi:hypothetical protein
MQVPVVVALAAPDGRVKFFDDSALYVADEWAEDEGGHGRTRTYLGFGSESWCMVCVADMLTKGMIRSISAPLSAYAGSEAT